MTPPRTPAHAANGHAANGRAAARRGGRPSTHRRTEDHA